MIQALSAPLLVFDLDGTLADTAGDLIATLNVILHREGLPPLSTQEAKPMVGAGAKALIERGLKASGVTVSEAKLEEMFDAYLAYYEAHICEVTELYPGLTAALDRFEQAGWIFAVCTNKIEHPSRLLLKALGIDTRFRAICGKNTFAFSKPHGEALLQTIARAGGDPRRSLMVGDTKVDIETARNAAVPVVAVDFGYTDQPIAHYKPDHVISHYDQLWKAVAALPFD
ncbi:HAD-IA family hydrolase [Beijerinckia indica]|uniref:Phosphoglycolate phosphatase n=1 Tax=Beijerinckia indica subsp. indica (strain ATCC 9039 / DSM 1715 / NCIMB 8712) TaxID=395963 RepID=B2IHK6_BEII9|nr:HAD-IA family hydrolase [Beijerinckia indica]ACB94527.1 phosphoglycolate phosphatase [Beijerinckia indica subsp. indica ATCC 9039]